MNSFCNISVSVLLSQNVGLLSSFVELSSWCLNRLCRVLEAFFGCYRGCRPVNGLVASMSTCQNDYYTVCSVKHSFQCK